MNRRIKSAECILGAIRKEREEAGWAESYLNKPSVEGVESTQNMLLETTCHFKKVLTMVGELWVKLWDEAMVMEKAVAIGHLLGFVFR